MALRIPSPVALTKPEAYLAYKAGILSRGELKDKLLNPINNYEGWLAKWCELLETYPTNEDGTPQCLTDEEGLLAYLCGVTNRYPASNSNPDDARVSAYIRYLVSARYARPDHPLNREEFYLSLIKTQFIPSGDPSSDIVIDGTTKAPFLDVKVYGDTLQNSYSGKNLLPFTNQDYTLSGVRVYVQDGELYLNGTSTANVSSNASYWKTSFAFTLPAGTYTLGALEYAFTQGEQFFMHKADQTDLGFIKNTTARTVTFTLEEETSVYLGIFWANGNVFNNKKISITLNSGSTAQPYEPYVGGIPAPNPDYPQPISVVTGENVVKITGRNLFDKNASYRGLGFTISTTSTGIETVLSASGNNYTYGGITIGGSELLGKTLTLSAKISQSGGATPRLVLAQSNTTGTIIVASLGTSLSATGSRTYTIPSTFASNADSIALIVYANNGGQGVAGDTITYDDLQLELGSTATDYEPYQGQEFTIDLDTIELAKIGTYQDRIYKSESKWYVEKQVGKVIFNGTQSLNYQNGDFTYSAFQTDGLPLPMRDSNSGSSASLLVISDHYTGQQSNYRDQCLEGHILKVTGSNNQVAWKDSRYNTATDMNTWLASNQTTVYYALATPTTTEITNQTLIDQLNALKQGGAEEGTTYIKVSATEPNLPAKLYVEAPKYD